MLAQGRCGDVAQLRDCVSADLGIYGGMRLNKHSCTCVRKVRRMSSMSQRARRTYIVVDERYCSNEGTHILRGHVYIYVCPKTITI